MEKPGLEPAGVTLSSAPATTERQKSGVCIWCCLPTGQAVRRIVWGFVFSKPGYSTLSEPWVLPLHVCSHLPVGLSAPHLFPPRSEAAFTVLPHCLHCLINRGSALPKPTTGQLFFRSFLTLSPGSHSATSCVRGAQICLGSLNS